MRVEGLFPGQGTASVSAADILSRLNIGDVIRAQILDFTANDVLLRLFDGTTFTAATMNSIEAEKGDFVNFTIKNKTDKQVFLETVKSNNSTFKNPDNEIKEALQSIEIKPDETNTKIAWEIKTSNLPLSKDTFTKVIDLIGRFKDLEPAKAVFLSANRIEPTETDILTLNRLVDDKFKLGANLEDLVKQLSGIDDKTVIDKIAERLNRFDSIKYDNADNNAKAADITPGNAAKTAAFSESPGKISDRIMQIVKNALENIPESTDNSRLRNLIQGLNLKEKISDFVGSALKNTVTANLPSDTLDFTAELIKNLSSSIPASEEKLLKPLNIIISGLKDQTDILQDLKQPQPKETAQQDIEKAKHFINKSFERLYVKINSEDFKNEINIKGAYKEMFEKLEIVKEAVYSSMLPNKDEVINKTDSIQNTVKFINEINSNNTYIQIPLNLGNSKTTGELYVLRRDSRKKKIGPDNATVFLSLNTQNLGQVDSLISVNKKNISINMRVEDKNVCDLIKENHAALYNSISNIGFKLVDLKYRVIEDNVNVLNVNKVVQKEVNRNKVSLDYRI